MITDMETLLAALRAAGERTRLRILVLLAEGEINVKDLTRVLGQSQPRVSRHLKLLCEAGLADRYREGNSVFYRLTDKGASGNLASIIISMLDRNSHAAGHDLSRLQAVRRARAKEARAYFDKNAAEWDRIRALHIAETEVEAAMLEMAGPGPFEAMLDLGTGTGRILELFSGQAGNCVGIDQSHEMLKFARAHLGRAGLGDCQLRHGDLTALPYDSASQDLVTLHQVLHFIENPAPAISEAARVLKPGGSLLIVDFAPHELEFMREEHAHRRLGFSSANMQAWINEAGLEMAEQKDLHRFGERPEGNLTVSLWLAKAPVTSHHAGTRQLKMGNA